MKITYSVIENCKTIDEAIEALEIYREELEEKERKEEEEKESDFCHACRGTGETTLGVFPGNCLACGGTGK